MLLNILKILSFLILLIIIAICIIKKNNKSLLYIIFDMYPNFITDITEDDLEKNFIVMQRNDTPQEFVYKRLKKALIIYSISQLIALLILNHVLAVILALLIAMYAYKSNYMSFTPKVKKRISEIDREFVRYFKTLQMLMNNYTINVALEKSLVYAPENFRHELIGLLKNLATGDDSPEVYRAFAELYNSPNIDTLMSLVYNLSLVNDEQKVKDLNIYSAEISQVSHTIRQIKYKERLTKIQTMGFIPSLIYVLTFIFLVFTSVFTVF